MSQYDTIRKNDSDGGEKMKGHVLKNASPIMISYLMIGTVCGMVLYEVGFSVLQIGLMSVFIYSGAGQFMLAGMYGSGASTLAIVITLLFLNIRFILLSLSSSKYVLNKSGLFLFLFGTTLTDETFGINYMLFDKGNWTPEDALNLNLINYASWITGTVAGGLLVSVLSIDTTLISYGLTALFIFMMASQFVSKVYIIAGLLSLILTVILMVILQNNIAIVIGALLASYIGLKLKWRFGREII